MVVSEYRCLIDAGFVGMALGGRDEEACPGWNATDDALAAALYILPQDGMGDFVLEIPETGDGAKGRTWLIQWPSY